MSAILKARISGRQFTFKVLKARQVQYVRKIDNFQGSGKPIYDYGENDKRTHPYFKKHLAKIDLTTPKSEAKVKVPKGSPWWNAMMPTESDYQKMQAGDEKALGDYFVQKLWRSADPEIEDGGLKVSNLVKNLPKVWVDGFGYQDIAQETFINILKEQRKGKLENVPIEKFPAYVAEIFKNTGYNLYRKAKAKKYVFQAFDDVEKKVKGYAESVDTILELETTKELAQNIISAMMNNPTINKDYKTIFIGWIKGEKTKDIAKKVKIKVKKNTPKIMAQRKNERVRGIISREIGNAINKILTKNKLDITYQALKPLFRKHLNFDVETGQRKYPKKKRVPKKKMPTKKAVKKTAKKKVAKKKAVKKKLKKASVWLIGGRLFLKAWKPGDKAEVGDIRTYTINGRQVQKRKVAPGKWEPIKGKKAKKEKTKEAMRSTEKDKAGEKGKGKLSDSDKKTYMSRMKEGIQGIVDTITDAMAGKPPQEKVAGELEKQEAISKQKKAINDQKKNAEKKHKEQMAKYDAQLKEIESGKTEKAKEELSSARKKEK